MFNHWRKSVTSNNLFFLQTIWRSRRRRIIWLRILRKLSICMLSVLWYRVLAVRVSWEIFRRFSKKIKLTLSNIWRLPIAHSSRRNPCSFIRGSKLNLTIQFPLPITSATNPRILTRKGTESQTAKDRTQTANLWRQRGLKKRSKLLHAWWTRLTINPKKITMLLPPKLWFIWEGSLNLGNFWFNSKMPSGSILPMSVLFSRSSSMRGNSGTNNAGVGVDSSTEVD